MNTGESEYGLRKILDMTRMMSLFLLVTHDYYYCYQAFRQWGLTTPLTNRLLVLVVRTGLLAHHLTTQCGILLLLFISLLGSRGKKEGELKFSKGLIFITSGLILFFGSWKLRSFPLSPTTVAAFYLTAMALGYLLILTGGTLLSRVIQNKRGSGDIFNTENESFPQEERLLQNEYSVNLPARYILKGKARNSWINIINPFRSLLVLGSPGSGKSYYVIRHVITQHLQKGFSMFIYDFKFDDLSLVAYNHYLKNRDRYPVTPEFYVINFEDLSRTHRCNPLDKENMLDITDASESARTILLGLNREWIRRQGDFFVESPINFLTAIIWFLRRYQDGQYCTLPHVIEFMQVDYDRLFTLLRTQKEVEALINPFVSAYINDVMEQLEGQVASAKVAMARLSSPQLYYVLSGSDFTLDINDPQSPKIVCMGSNPQKLQVYGAVLSLYITRLIRIVNKKGKLKSSLIFDEFPTIYLNHMDSLIATARSNKVATTLGIQDFSQLKKDYGRDQADVIMNISGNIISGQVNGETAKQLSDRFGRILQDRSGISVNRTDTSVSYYQQLDPALPPSKIASLSSGEFVGMVADDPGSEIRLKAFHCSILNDHESLKKEAAAFQPLPVIRPISGEIIQQNYLQIKHEVEDLVATALDQILSDPSRVGIVVKKDKRTG